MGLQLPCPISCPVLTLPTGGYFPTILGADTEPSVFLWNAVATLSVVLDKESGSPYKLFIA